MTLTNQQREKRRRDYNRWCQEQADKIGREGAGETISFSEYDQSHKLQIAINKYNKGAEE